MKTFTIKNIFGKTIIKEKANSLKEVVEKNKDNLQFADLSKTDLCEANLSRANLRGADLSGADLSKADLSRANLRGANLYKANLSRADLQDADFQGCNLYGCNLQDTNLYRCNFQFADLSEADLQDVKNLPLPDLYILKSVKGKIRAYKLVNKNYEGIYNGGLKYQIGKIVKVDDYDEDERILCGKGINVATLEWCRRMREDSPLEIPPKILEVEFDAKDIVAIPYTTDGKFRIKRCKVIREVE